jgi:hypothetical protein
MTNALKLAGTTILFLDLGMDVSALKYKTSLRKIYISAILG